MLQNLKKSVTSRLAGATAALRKRRMAREETIETIEIQAEAAASIGKACVNCGTILHGAFCHGCGQKDSDLRRPIWSFSHELVENVFAADSRFVKTLALLLMVPGGLTRSYMEGRRQRYMPPVRLYIGSTLVFFLTLYFAQISIIDIRLVERQVTASSSQQEQNDTSETTEKSASDAPAGVIIEGERLIQEDLQNDAVIDETLNALGLIVERSDRQEIYRQIQQLKDAGFTDAAIQWAMMQGQGAVTISQFEEGTERLLKIGAANFQ